MAPSVKCPALDLGLRSGLRSLGIEPHVRLHAAGRSCLKFSPSALTPAAHSLSLSLK